MPSETYVTGPMKRALNTWFIKVHSLIENLIRNVLSYPKHTLSYKSFFESMWDNFLLRKRELKLGKISVVLYYKRLSSVKDIVRQRSVSLLCYWGIRSPCQGERRHPEGKFK